MFSNIGGKIQKLAKITCIVGCIASLILAILTGTANSYRTPTILPGIITLVVGVLVSWVGSFFTYGFGQLIEDTALIRYELSNMSREAKHLSVVSKSVQNPGNVPSSGMAYMHTNSGEVWKCKKCGEINLRSQMSCKSCGEYK